MKLWCWVGTLTCISAVALGVTAYGHQGGDKDKLVWKAFDSDKPAFYQEMKTVTKQTMKVQSMEVVQDQTQTFVVKWTPKPKKGDDWVVQQEIIAVKMNIKIGGNEIAFDSKDEKAPSNPLTDFFKTLVSSGKFTLIIDSKTLKVKDVEGVKEFVDKLSQTNEQLKELLKNILSKDALIQMSEPTFAAFPKDGNLDKKWENQVKLNLGPIGTYDTTYIYTPESDSKIKVNAVMKWIPPDGSAPGGLPFIIKGGNLKTDKAEGTVYYDKAAGLIKKSDMKLDLSGKLQIDIGGMTTEVDLVQSQTSTLETFADDPTKKK